MNCCDLAVLNAGAISYSPLLARRLFDGVVSRYRPTLVLYLLDATDIGDDYSYGEQSVGWGEEAHFELEGACPRAYYGALAEVLFLSGVVDHVLRPIRFLERLAGHERPARTLHRWYDFELRIGDRLETNRFFIYRHPLERTRSYFEGTHGHIKALARAARASGADFVLVVLPRFHHWNPKECPQNWESEQYTLDEPYQYESFRFFQEKSKESEFDILDLLPAFRESRDFPLVFRSDPHWNEDGHDFVAGVLSDYLIESGRVR